MVPSRERAFPLAFYRPAKAPGLTWAPNPPTDNLWRLLQSKVGIENADCRAKRSRLKKVDAGEIPLEDFLTKTGQMFAQELAEMTKKA